MSPSVNRDQENTSIRYLDPQAIPNETVKTPLGEFTVNTLGETATIKGAKDKFKERRARIVEKHEVTIHDARDHYGRLNGWDFEKNGFSYISAAAPTAVFDGDNLVYQNYIPQVAELVRQNTGAKRAFGVGHQQVRTEATGRTTSQTSYARFAHTDYGPTFESQFRRVIANRFDVPEDEAKSCGLCVVGYWAPIERPSYKDPLCIIDAQTSDPEKEGLPYIYTGIAQTPLNEGNKSPDEYIPTPGSDAPALAPIYSPAHKWYYASDMRPEEAVIFKQFDMRPDVTSKVCFHNSFRDRFHEDWAECPGRRSIEIRILVTF